MMDDIRSGVASQKLDPIFLFTPLGLAVFNCGEMIS